MLDGNMNSLGIRIRDPPDPGKSHTNIQYVEQLISKVLMQNIMYTSKFPWNQQLIGNFDLHCYIILMQKGKT